jgi:hypothetical protein
VTLNKPAQNAIEMLRIALLAQMIFCPGKRFAASAMMYRTKMGVGNVTRI